MVSGLPALECLTFGILQRPSEGISCCFSAHSHVLSLSFAVATAQMRSDATATSLLSRRRRKADLHHAEPGTNELVWTKMFHPPCQQRSARWQKKKKEKKRRAVYSKLFPWWREVLHFRVWRSCQSSSVCGGINKDHL